MSIQVKQSSMVRPAEETPRRTLRLSNLDLVIMTPYTHTHSVHFYKYVKTTTVINATDNNNKDDDHFDLRSSKKFFDTETLKHTLSRVLVPFYPVAGRLNWDENGKLEIDCNGEGVLFVEAETTQYTLADIEETDFTPSNKLFELLIPKSDYTKGVNSFPLLMVQLTRFRCGGVALGFAQHHQLGDGAAYLYFLVSWSRLARGLDLEYPPVVDRVPHLMARCPPQVQFHHLEYQHSMQGLYCAVRKNKPIIRQGFSELETATATLSICRLSKDQISALKLKAMSAEEVRSYKLSTFEVVAGHLWRSACKARGLAHDQEVKISVPVDGRSRLGIPNGYFGNAIFHAACIAKAGDVTCRPLWYAASEIHKAVKMRSNDYLRSAIDYLELQPVTEKFHRGHTCSYPDLLVNTWARLPHYETDYGWGAPIFAGMAGIRCEGQCFILQTPTRDGNFLVVVKLLTLHMASFQKYLYDF